jgi:hypothetical protein
VRKESAADHDFGLPQDLLKSDVYKLVPGTALKILFAIGSHWIAGGFRDNNKLIVTYRMLMVATGIGDKHTISLGLAQLEALQMLNVSHGKSMGSERTPNQYGFPWIKGHNGGPPTKAYLEISYEEGKRLLDKLKEKKQRKDSLPRSIEVKIRLRGF